MINVTNYVSGQVVPWVDDQHPGTDYEGPFESAIAAANSNGDEIYFPPGIYWLNKPIYKTGLKNLRFYGPGAVIKCRGTQQEFGYNGVGGGFTLYGDSIVIDGLRFEGFAKSIGDYDCGYGMLLFLNGNNNIVKNCYFKDGNGGAVVLTGNYNVITNNVFENCNNYPPPGGGDYGAIHITGACKYNTISENKIFGHFYSGICGYGTGANNGLAYLDIINNYIRSNSSSANHSMGIFLLQGANEKIKIIGNTIEKVDAEGIMIESTNSFPASKCIISNNIIKDCNFVGISLQNTTDPNTYPLATFTDFTIIGNIIENTPDALGYDHHIFLDRVQDSIISNNKCIGIKNGSTYLGWGISFSNSCPRNQVCNNQLRTFLNGIIFYSSDGALKDNHITNCDTGIALAYCRGASIAGNIVNSCTTGISYGSNSSPLHIIGNVITECTNRYVGTVAPEVLTHSGVANLGTNSYSNFVVTDQLGTGGSKSVTFYNVYAGDRFLVLPANESGTGAGAMYIALIDVANNKVLVKSTDTNDTRAFMLIKMISGG